MIDEVIGFDYILNVILFFYFRLMASHNELGKKGEELAIDFLQKKKYSIIARNYRFDKAEVDIIAQMEDILVIVEVKTRSSKDFGNPEEFVKPKLEEYIEQLKNAYDAIGLDEISFKI